jgi:Spy/CpxP family protein refolding chaperone
MHGMRAFWHHARERAGYGEGASCGPDGGCGPSAGHGGHGRGGFYASGGDHDGHDGHFAGGGGFGVRRPLRFLAFKLELEEEQVTKLAHILSDLKTERAQAAVDDRRTTAAFADGISADAFDDARFATIANERVKSAEHLRDAVVKALKSIHAVLDPEQRARFAYLLRTGALSI